MVDIRCERTGIDGGGAIAHDVHWGLGLRGLATSMTGEFKDRRS